MNTHADTPPHALPQQRARLQLKLKIARLASLFSYIALLLVIAINQGVQANGSIKYWILQSVPLLIFVPGIFFPKYVQRPFRTYSWMCFVILIYFIHYADKLSTDPGSIVNWIAIFLTVLLFNSAMMTSRWMQYFSLIDSDSQTESQADNLTDHQIQHQTENNIRDNG